MPGNMLKPVIARQLIGRGRPCMKRLMTIVKKYLFRVMLYGALTAAPSRFAVKLQALLDKLVRQPMQFDENSKKMMQGIFSFAHSKHAIIFRKNISVTE